MFPKETWVMTPIKFVKNIAKEDDPAAIGIGTPRRIIVVVSTVPPPIPTIPVINPPRKEENITR